ncbi:hypothetical protein LCGC14_1031370 [marine sediment metagenome]|uniref:Uncharacterized protein n=1 Tax=marine sediment metagenome TaxID=412755 RepID=A0A0F9NG97_9ZZZZ
MLAEFSSSNLTDANDLPAGGMVDGVGLSIQWQSGPLGKEGVDRIEPNGAFVETLIAAALQRIRWYQEVCGGKFRCMENTNAIAHLSDALRALDQRTKNREARGVEGTHQE